MPLTLSVQGTSFPADGPVPLSTNFATVKFSEKSFTVHPGQTQELTAHITPPTGIDPSILPVFSGFIQIANPTESFHVTYLGVGAALKDAQVVDTTDVFFGVDLPALVDGEGNFLSGPQNFTFVGDDEPSLIVRLDFGTPILRVDLVDPNIKLATTLNQRSMFTFPQAVKGGSFSQVKTIGSLIELDFIPRNSDQNVCRDFLLHNTMFVDKFYRTGWLWLQPDRIYQHVCQRYYYSKWFVQDSPAGVEGDGRPYERGGF